MNSQKRKSRTPYEFNSVNRNNSEIRHNQSGSRTIVVLRKKNVFRFTLSQQHIVQKIYKESATDLQIDGWTYLQLISQVEPSFLPKSCPSCKVNIELRTTKFKCYQNLEEYAIEILCGPGFHYKSTIEQIVFIERLNNKKKHFQVLFISSNAFNPRKRRLILSVNCNLNNEECEDISSDKVKRFQELLSQDFCFHNPHSTNVK